MEKQYKKVCKYLAIFEPDQETGGFTVTIPDLPGCISEGETFEEALANIKEAAELYLETTNDKIDTNSCNNIDIKYTIPIEVKV